MNPVEKRLAKLRGVSDEFLADSNARVLHLLLDAGEDRLVDTFVEVESHETKDGDTLYLRLRVPFEDEATHGHRLVRALVGFYRELGDELRDAGVTTSWGPPRIKERDPGGVEALHEALGSFHATHQPLFRTLVLVLMPTRIDSPAAWARWVERLAAIARAPEVRFVVLDARTHPLLLEPARRQAAVVRTVTPALDVPAMAEELSEQAGRLDTPPGEFRHLYVQLTRAVSENDLARAERLAASAIRLAEREGWLHLVVAVHFVLAAGHQGRNDVTRAAQAYQSADQAATRLETRTPEEFELGRSLRVKSRLALGGVLVVGGAPRLSAEVYEATAPMAEEVKDLPMVFECWRMASYAHEQDNKLDDAWRCGLAGMAVGRRLDPKQRASSTLPFLGVAMERLAKRGKYAAYRDGIDQQMCQLVGIGWRELAKPADAPTEPGAEGEVQA